MDSLSFIETSGLFFVFTNISDKENLPYALYNRQAVKDIFIDKYEIDPSNPLISKDKDSKKIYVTRCKNTKLTSTGSLSKDKERIKTFIDMFLDSEPFNTIKEITRDFIENIDLIELEYLNIFHIIYYDNRKCIISLSLNKEMVTKGFSLFGSKIIDDYFDYEFCLKKIAILGSAV